MTPLAQVSGKRKELMAAISSKAATARRVVRKPAPKRARPYGGRGRRARASVQNQDGMTLDSADVLPADAANDADARWEASSEKSGPAGYDDGDDAIDGSWRAAARPSRARRARRDQTTGDTGNFLAKYFRDMAALSVLKPEEEFVAAREIEELEIRVWQALLSHAPAVDLVLSVAETCMENSISQFRSLRRAANEARRSQRKAVAEKHARAARRCSEKLQALDTDKNYLEAVLAELGRVERNVPGRLLPGKVPFSTRSRAFRRYMQAVRGANREAAEARNDFVRANLRLVVSIARRFNHGRMALADLIQEGNLGLMKAVERYDYRRGFRFSTYASWWIRHAISRALADKGREVRLPVHMIDAQQRLAKAKRELTAKLGRQATTEELAKATRLAPEKIEKMRTYLFDQSFSLDRPVNDEDGRHFIDFLRDPKYDESSPADDIAVDALTKEVRRQLMRLKPIEADILRQRFGLDDDHELTLKEIGAKYNLSRERIRQLQEQALSKMRKALQRKDMI